MDQLKAQVAFEDEFDSVARAQTVVPDDLHSNPVYFCDIRWR
jgi:hypothetical protein